MKRHEHWRHTYRKNRYLVHLDQDELRQRGRDTLLNPLVLSTDAKIGLLDPNEFGSEAMERFTHYLEECQLRGLDYQENMKSLNLKETMPNLTSDLGKRAASAIKTYDFGQKPDLFKFGKAKYLKPLLDEGHFRIQPASSFANPNHNIAVGDNELTRSFKLAISAQEAMKAFEDFHKDGTPLTDNPEINISFYTDYWVTCFSRYLQPRMSVDFDADAALVVINKQEFRRRLRNAVRETTVYSAMKDGPVHYFDPYLPTQTDFRNIPLIKPLRYYYQQEFRYFWLPEQPTETLDFIDVALGKLDDIATLLTW